MDKKNLATLLMIITILTGCGGGGGGGGGGSGSSSSQSVSCLSSQVSGCNFSASDPTQTVYGWWSGTRTVSTGTANIFMASDSNNSVSVLIGDDFNGGFLDGSMSIIGSTIGSINLVGADNLAGSNNNSCYTIYSVTGGVVTGSIFSLQSASGTNYCLLNGVSMSMQYNSLGDRTLASFAGTYSNGNKSLVIASNGQITATYTGMNLSSSPAFNAGSVCSLTTTLASNTLMKNVVISGTDSCLINNTIKLYAKEIGGITKMVMRMRSNANQLSPVVLQ